MSSPELNSSEEETPEKKTHPELPGPSHEDPPPSRRHHYSQLARNACPERCAICGAPAAGYHYEVTQINGNQRKNGKGFVSFH